MPYDFTLPRGSSPFTREIHRIDAIILTRGVLGIGLSNAKTLIDKNFPGYGNVPTNELGQFLSAAIPHFVEK